MTDLRAQGLPTFRQSELIPWHHTSVKVVEKCSLAVFPQGRANRIWGLFNSPDPNIKEILKSL